VSNAAFKKIPSYGIIRLLSNCLTMYENPNGHDAFEEWKKQNPEEYIKWMSEKSRASTARLQEILNDPRQKAKLALNLEADALLRESELRENSEKYTKEWNSAIDTLFKLAGTDVKTVSAIIEAHTAWYESIGDIVDWDRHNNK